MSNPCENPECFVHTRQDGVKYDQEGFLVGAGHYVGDKFVLTKLNILNEGVNALMLALNGQKAREFMTVVIQLPSDTASLADTVEGVDDTLFVDTHGDIEDEGYARAGAEKFHNGIVDAVRADGLTLNLLSIEQIRDELEKSVSNVY